MRALGFRKQASMYAAGVADYGTPGSYVWTCPNDVTSVTVSCTGGGGNGGEARGGGGGGYGSKVVSVTPGVEYTVEVGAAAGNSYFNSLATVAGYGGAHGADGGAGGIGVGTTTASGSNGQAGTYSAGTPTGSYPNRENTDTYTGGNGGASGSGGPGGGGAEVYHDLAQWGNGEFTFYHVQFREFNAGPGSNYGGGGGGRRTDTLNVPIDPGPPTVYDDLTMTTTAGSGAGGQVYLSW